MDEGGSEACGARRLPEGLGALLRVAVADMDGCRGDPRYRLRMGAWHMPGRVGGVEGAPCEVCLAGAVMARSLGADPEEWLAPAEWTEDTRARLRALDLMRLGRVGEAFDRIGRRRPRGLRARRPMPGYDGDGGPVAYGAFRDALLELACDLEQAGA